MNMKKYRISIISKIQILCLLFLCCSSFSRAENLLTVYEQALQSDPTYHQIIAQQLAVKEGVPINVATILPNASVSATPSVTRTGYSGSLYSKVGNGSLSPRNNTSRAYALTLTVTQTVFNFAEFAAIAGAHALSRGADATINAALQDLMLRVSAAYFTVLQDADNIDYNLATKRAYALQLQQMKQQYQVGIKTQTDVYTAQASYDSAVASLIAAETKLANDKENLRAITGQYYAHLSPLSKNFPLVKPNPDHIELWVNTAVKQNWTIKAAQYNVNNARQVIRQQFAGHLPTIDAQLTIDRQYVNNLNSYNSLNQRNGPGTQSDRSIGLNINFPIFAGGGVVAQTHQATYNFQAAEQQLEQTLRNTLNLTRQSYLGVVSGISQIRADREVIKSTMSSLAGMRASYHAGIGTLFDVLDQQQKVFEAQLQYATDRYTYVNNLLALKQAAGTLSVDDLRAINAWLG